MERKFLAPDYEQEEALLEARQMSDDDMWEAYAHELTHYHKPHSLNLASLLGATVFDPDATEGVKP